MLTIRRFFTSNHSARSYRRSAILLLHNGRVLGEVLVLDAQEDGFGGARVKLGFSLPTDISVVRADVGTLDNEAEGFVRAREQYLGWRDDAIDALPRPAPRTASRHASQPALQPALQEAHAAQDAQDDPASSRYRFRTPPTSAADRSR